VVVRHGRASPDELAAERSAAAALVEVSFSVVPHQERPLGIGDPLRLGSLEHVTIRDERVESSGVGGIEEIQAETGEVEMGRAEARRGGDILEDHVPQIAVEAVGLRLEIGHDDVEPPVAVQVAGRDTALPFSYWRK